MRIESPIKITGVKNGLVQQELHHFGDQQAFLENLLASEAEKQAKGLMTRSPIRINSIAAAAYGQKQVSDKQLQKLISQTLDSRGNKKVVSTKRGSPASMHLYEKVKPSVREQASNYTLNMESNHYDAEAKLEAAKTTW